MTLHMKKWARHIFSELKNLIHELICVKNIFYPASIKNDNGAVAMIFFLCDANGTNNSIN